MIANHFLYHSIIADKTSLERNIRDHLDELFFGGGGRMKCKRGGGVADTHHRHGLLVMAEDERFFTISGIHDAMGFEGCGFLDAMDNLLFAQSAPMIRPDQEFVSWYGIKYEHGDPALYSYDSP